MTFMPVAVVVAVTLDPAVARHRRALHEDVQVEAGRELLAARARHDRAARLGAELLELGVAEATLLHHFIGLVDVDGVRRLSAGIADLHDLPWLRAGRRNSADHDA